MSVPVEYGPMTEIQMQPEEIEYITKCITEMPSDGLMVEWGSGGSTVRWLETMTNNQELISIEHNEQWFDKVSEYIDTRDDINDRFTYHFRPELYGTKHGYATPTEEHPMGLDEYFWPDERLYNADMYLIDGIARATCSIFVKMLSQKENPTIFIHDFTGREPWYRWATRWYEEEKIGKTLVRLYKK